MAELTGLTPPLISERADGKVRTSNAGFHDGSRIPSLDGLRAVSILIVILFHMSLVGLAPSFFKRADSFGVQIFFVISGYLITSLLAKEREQTGTISLKAFYLRRVFRIVPAAYCYLAIVVGFYWALFRPIDVFSVFTFTSNYDLGRPPIVAHIWSLSVEEQFYILWPITLCLFFQQRLRILLWALCLFPLMIIGFHLLHWNTYRGFAFPTAYDSLALGCLAAVLGSRLNFLRSYWFFLAGVVAVLLQWFPWPDRVPAFVRVLLFWPMTHLCIAIFVVNAIHRRY